MEFLKGKKTYIVGAVSLVLAGLNIFHVIQPDTYEQLLGFLLPFGVFAVRSAMTTESKKN